MSTREENHEYALAIIEAKNADIRVLQGAIHKLTSALIEAGVERSTLRAERDALRREVQQSRLEFQIMQAHAKQDALAVQPTTGETP